MEKKMEKNRTTKTQFKIYLSFLRENPVLLTGKINPSTNPEDLIKVWENLTIQLNSFGDGPIRDTSSWKKAFTEWKSNARKKAREHKPLTELENAIINITGVGAVKGMTVAEVGLQVQNEPKDDEEFQYQKENLNLGENLVDEVPKMDFELDEEVVVLEVVEDDDKPQEVIPKIPKKDHEKKKSRKTTNDILCDTYTQAASQNSEQLQNIADAILEVAKAINRYCDIAEK